MKPCRFTGIVVLLTLALTCSTRRGCAADWPQFQANAMRTGRTADSVAAPYRVRWIWCGPNLSLRNQDSHPGWTNDLWARDGYSYPMPRSVGFTLANSVLPIVVGNRVFVGSLEGTAYAID